MLVQAFFATVVWAESGKEPDAPAPRDISKYITPDKAGKYQECPFYKPWFDDPVAHVFGLETDGSSVEIYCGEALANCCIRKVKRK